MSDLRNQLHQDLSDAVVELDDQKAADTAHRVVENQLDAYEAVDQGLSAGMGRASQLFDEDVYFVPELLVAADALYAGLDVLRPHIQVDDHPVKGKVVIGVVEGDTHDIGKNLVRILLEAAGFEVYDLGRDVPPQTFVDRAREVQADIIALSTLMTTTLEGFDEVIRLLKAEGVRDQFKVIVGGAPVTQGYADNIGADGYARDASAAVALVRKLLAQKVTQPA